MMTVDHNYLLERIKSIKNLIKPDLGVSREIIQITGNKVLRVLFTDVALEDSDIAWEISNIGVDFNYVIFATESTRTLPPFFIRVKYCTMHMLLDEHYHLINDDLLKNLVKESRIIEFGSIVKECNFT